MNYLILLRYGNVEIIHVFNVWLQNWLQRGGCFDKIEVLKKHEEFIRSALGQREKISSEG